MSVQVFSFEGSNIRTVVGEHGETLFVGKDVCEVLGYKDTTNAVKQHCKGVAKHPILDSLGRTQEVRVLTANDVLRLLTSSHKTSEDLLDKVLNQITDVQKIVKALQDFEVPEDLPGMYVYAIRNSVTGNIKLGISRNPEARLKQLQVGNDCKLELVATREAKNRFADEAAAHDLNSGYHIHGEWFTSQAQLPDAKRTLAFNALMPKDIGVQCPEASGH